MDMVQASVLTAVSLPGVSAHPSSSCLQWSGDGQAVLLARNAVYILTPHLGVGVEASPYIKQSLRETGGDRPIQWLRTMIEWDKDSGLHQWTADCQDWGSVSLGSLDPQFRAVTCSPSNLTADSGCVYAVLNSNLEVSLWASVKNHLVGVWSKIGSYNATQSALRLANDTDSALHRTLQAQIACIAWSAQANFESPLLSSTDTSLLALGSRAGTVCLARFTCNSNQPQYPLQHVALFSVGDRWVTHLAWSPWVTSQSGQCQAYLACGISDGSITVVKVTQQFQEIPEHTGFLMEYEGSVSWEVLSDKACEANNIGITSLRWIQTVKPDPFLVFSSPGQIHIWSSAPSPGAWQGSCVIPLRTVKTCLGSSSLVGVSGIAYIQRFDTLVISLADGSFHVFSHFSTGPQPAHSHSDAGLSTEALSTVSRSIFTKVERDQPQGTDVNKISGMMLFDNTSVYSWVHELVQPTSFDYKHDAKHSSTLVVARLSPLQPDTEILDSVVEIIRGSGIGHSPLALLRPILLHLQTLGSSTRLRGQILQLLREPRLTALTSVPAPPLWSGGLTPQFRTAFRKSLNVSLFGHRELFAQRMAMSLAKFCQSQPEDMTQGQQFEQVSRDISGTLWRQVLLVVIRHLTACVNYISNTEIPFVLRIVVQALLLGTPTNLDTEARGLAARANVVVPASADLSSIGAETCPACHATVPFQDMDQAVCANGHTWARCSITSFLLSTPMVRTCLGCTRKAFLPPPGDVRGLHWLPLHARSWAVEDILEAVQRCLSCGNRFVTLL